MDYLGLKIFRRAVGLLGRYAVLRQVFPWSRSVNHPDILRIATRAPLLTPGESCYVLGHILMSGLLPSLFQCCFLALLWFRSAATAGCSACPRHPRALGGYLKPRASITAEPQLVAGHLFHFINKIRTCIDKGFCPLIVSLALRQLTDMTFCLCSHFHNGIQGRGWQPICRALAADIASFGNATSRYPKEMVRDHRWLMNLMGHFIKIMMATKIFPSDNNIYNKKRKHVKEKENIMD